MANKKKPHAIMIPLPHQGHINPFINLALKLASKGFVITFINFEFVHQMMSTSHDNHDSDLFSEARNLGMDIRYTTIGDGFPLDFDRVLHLEEFWDTMLRDFPARIDEFIGKLIESNQDLVHFLVADTLYSWYAEIAKKYNIVSVSFWTEPALVFSLIYHSEILRERGHFPCKDNMEEEINYIPGIKSINTKDLMPYLRESGVKTTSHRLVFDGFKEARKADFILHNTVEELESDIVSALNEHKPNYAVGPINFSKNNLATDAHVMKSLWSESACTHWLESKPPGSVLYVSFGSLVQTSKEVIQEIAHGLLLSEVNFIWVVRSGVAGSVNHHDDIFPDGFVDEANDKGLIVPWCDQIMVLSNPRVGGFLTHCGWNSILESIWCGTPMICYPITYDQPVNRKLVVDDWKVGINLCDGSSVTREEVAEKIRKLMISGPDSEGFNRNILEIRGKLLNAVEIQGSLEKNIDQFIKDLNIKIGASI